MPARTRKRSSVEEFVDQNIALIPYKYVKKPGSKKTVILFNGGGENHETWDNTDIGSLFKTIIKDEPDFKKHADIMLKSKSNFQKAISKHYSTFSFTPFESLLLSNTLKSTKYEPMEPNNYFWDIRQMIYTMRRLIEIHKLQPPYILVGFSEGAMRALLYEQTISHVEKCVLIDPQRFKPAPECKDGRRHSKEVLERLMYYKCYNFLRRFRLPRQSKTPLIVHINLSDLSPNSYTEQFMGDVAYINALRRSYPSIEIAAYFDKPHYLHYTTFRRQILQSILDN